LVESALHIGKDFARGSANLASAPVVSATLTNYRTYSETCQDLVQPAARPLVIHTSKIYGF
jgi:hypothetical protein